MKECKYVVGVDMDMVLVDWVSSLLDEIWRRMFPFPRILNKDMEKWLISQNYPEEYQEQVMSIFKFPEPGLYYSFKPMDGALEALQELSEVAHIVIVSTPAIQSLYTYNNEWNEYVQIMNQVSAEKLNWIRDYVLPAIGYMPETLFVSDKGSFHGHVLVDDRPDVSLKTRLLPVWNHVLYDDDFAFNRDVEAKYRISWKKSGWKETIVEAAEANVKIITRESQILV